MKIYAKDKELLLLLTDGPLKLDRILRNLPVGEPYVSSDRMVVLERALAKAGLTPEYRDRRIDVWLEADHAVGRSLLVHPGAQGVSGVYAAGGARA